MESILSSPYFPVIITTSFVSRAGSTVFNVAVPLLLSVEFALLHNSFKEGIFFQ